MPSVNRIILLLSLTTGIWFSGLSQPLTSDQDSTKKIKIRQARSLSFSKEKLDAQKFKGDVIIQHDSTLIYCDSVYFFDKDNRIEAYSNVRIVMPDSVVMVCDRMDYDGTTRIADAFRNITLTDGEAILETSRLSYFRNETYGEYRNGGTLYNGDDTLTSKLGYFYPNDDMAYFRKDVVLWNPEYRLETDTLGYNTKDKVALFMTETHITNQDGKLNTRQGEYHTESNELFLFARNELQNEDYKVVAENLNFDNKTSIGIAKKDVVIEPKDSSMTITGQYGWFNQEDKISFVTDTAVAVQYLDDDTLYVTADTLYTLEDSAEHRTFKAFYHVYFFMNEMQGQADSMIYRYSDSLIELYGNPMIWADSSQISADTIRLYLANDKADSMSLSKNAFVISLADSAGFNQIKGRNIQARFQDNSLRHLHVTGNAETIYFGKDEETGGYLAMSQSSSQEMDIFMENNRVVKVKNIKDVQAVLEPYWKIMYETNQLGGVNWRYEERPQKPESPKAFGVKYAMPLAVVKPTEVAEEPEGEPLPDENKP